MGEVKRRVGTNHQKPKGAANRKQITTLNLCVHEQNKEKRTNQTLVEPVSQFYVYFIFHLSTLRLPLSLLSHLRVR